MTGRIVSWFSCGAASAVATKLAIAQARQPVVVAYCEIKEEHPDNKRFLKDCEDWFGQEILILGNDEYNRSAYEVFRRTRYLKGPNGARCTTELKRAVRMDFQEPTDTLVFGYTYEEKHRLDRIMKSEPGMNWWPVLIENGLTKENCLAMVERAGIELPAMYKLGYRNNNCIGCVKGEAGYWNKIRRDFPDVFEKMAGVEQDLGRTVCKREWTDEDGKRQLERFPLTELDPDQGIYPDEPGISCGLLCYGAETLMDRSVQREVEK